MNRTRQGLVVSERHENWLKSNANPTYSERALKHCETELRKQASPRIRRSTVSASSLGSCRRRQIFTFLGWSELPPTPKLATIFQNGTMMHIRWQMAGLTEGWLAEAEVPVGKNAMSLSGTQDGIAHEGSVVEFKSINSNGFRGVNTFGVKDEHRFQVGTYMATTGNTKAVVIYEDKDTQEFKEFVVELDDQLAWDIQEITDLIWGLINDKNLPEPLGDCIDQKGYRYHGCPFRDRCLKIKNWQEAQDLADHQGEGS